MENEERNTNSSWSWRIRKIFHFPFSIFHFKTYIPAAIIIFGFVAVFGLSNFLEKNRPALPENYIDEDLSLQGKKLKGFSLGFEGLIGDWYWMRSLQYIGNKLPRSKLTGY